MIKGIDCNTKLSYEIACRIFLMGYNFAMRYIGRNTMANHDIDIIEKNNILNAGLDLGLVQHCPGKSGIIPSKEIGIKWGANAREFSKQVEYEQGKIVYLDLENVNIEYKTKQDLIYDYCSYWYQEVYKFFTPGIYIGFNNFMSSQQLYFKLPFKDYWRACSPVPEIYKRGYAMIQKVHAAIFGIPIDENIVTGDRLGRFPAFMKGKVIVDPKKDIRNAAKKILKEEAGMDLNYWDQQKYFDEFAYKLGVMFQKWGKI